MSTATVRTGDEMVQQAEQFLLSIQNPDGGWGYSPEQISQPEPTAIVVLALARNYHCADAVRRGVDCLLAMQDVQGAFRVQGGFAKSSWPSALAAIAIQHADDRRSAVAVSKTVKWLIGLRSKTSALNEEL